MRKIISILVLVLWLAPFEVECQDASFGLQVSPMFCTMSNNSNLINSSGLRLGLKIGGIGEYYLSDWMVLYGGAGFSFSQGGKLLHKFGGNLLPDSDLSDSKFNSGEKPLPNDVEITYALQMLEVPMGLRYEFNLSSKPYRVYLAFPEFYLGVISRSRGKIEGTGVSLKNEDIGGDVKPFNFAWGLGVGIVHPMDGEHYLTAGLHIQRGLSDVTSNDGAYVDNSNQRHKEDSKGHLNGLILKFAYFF